MTSRNEILEEYFLTAVEQTDGGRGVTQGTIVQYVKENLLKEGDNIVRIPMKSAAKTLLQAKTKGLLVEHKKRFAIPKPQSNDTGMCAGFLLVAVAANDITKNENKRVYAQISVYTSNDALYMACGAHANVRVISKRRKLISKLHRLN